MCACVYVRVYNLCETEGGKQGGGDAERECWSHGLYEITRKLMKTREARWEECKAVMSSMLKLLTAVSWQKKQIQVKKGVEEKRTFKEAEGSSTTKKHTGEVVLRGEYVTLGEKAEIRLALRDKPLLHNSK